MRRQLDDDSPVFALDWASGCAGRVFLASLSSSVSVEEREVYRKKEQAGCLQALSLTGPARGASGMSRGSCHGAGTIVEGKKKAKNGNGGEEGREGTAVGDSMSTPESSKKQ